jgi:tetratricopeptide (TPR) repeat protein
MRRLLKAITIWGLASLMGGLLLSAQIIPALAQHHHSSPDHSSPASTNTKPSITPAPSPQPSKVEAFVNQGLEKLHKQDYAGALKDFDQVIKLDKDHDRAYLYRADLRSQVGDYQGAIQDYTIAKQQNSSFSYIYNQQGKAYEALRNYPKAIENYTQAIKLYPEDGIGYANRGIAYYKLGHNQQAMENFNKAIVINHGQADAYFNRGNLHTKLGNNQAAIADYQKARLLYSEQGKRDSYLKTALAIQELSGSSEPTTVTK